VAEGELAVDVDRERRPFTPEPGDGYGEIALLHAVPRTATITARVAGRLLVVDVREFLASVTGSADGHAMAAEVTEQHLARDGR